MRRVAERAAMMSEDAAAAPLFTATFDFAAR